MAEHQPSKLRVAGSRPVSRSINRVGRSIRELTDSFQGRRLQVSLGGFLWRRIKGLKRFILPRQAGKQREKIFFKIEVERVILHSED